MTRKSRSTSIRSPWFRLLVTFALVWVGQWGVAQSPPPNQARQPVLPDDRLGVRTAPLLLLTRPDIRADLKMTPDQVASASRALSDLMSQAAKLRDQPNAPEVLAARRAIDEAQQHWISTQLTKEQQSRLVQLDLQWEGPVALIRRPVVAETLGLSVEQRERLQQLLTSSTSVAPTADVSRQALEVLRPEQSTRYRSMLGRPLTFRHDMTSLAGQNASAPTTPSTSAAGQGTRDEQVKTTGAEPSNPE